MTGKTFFFFYCKYLNVSVKHGGDYGIDVSPMDQSYHLQANHMQNGFSRYLQRIQSLSAFLWTHLVTSSFWTSLSFLNKRCRRGDGECLLSCRASHQHLDTPVSCWPRTSEGQGWRPLIWPPSSPVQRAGRWAQKDGGFGICPQPTLDILWPGETFSGCICPQASSVWKGLPRPVFGIHRSYFNKARGHAGAGRDATGGNVLGRKRPSWRSGLDTEQRNSSAALSSLWD